MPKQLNLLKECGFKLELPDSSQEPLVWFKRLVIWSDSKTKIRSISFRPGLNIVWSPDLSDQPVGNQPRALGHGSGKTLLCRMMRYCLGEDRYTTAEQRNSIALAFPKGMVGAEIMIAGTLWAILRPIGTGRQHYAAPEIRLEELVYGDFDQTTLDPLFSSLEQKVLTGDVISLVSGESPHHAWLTALALISRDQECRFNHALELRSAASDSGSPVRSLSLTNILDSLRVAVGAVNPKEFELRSEIKVKEAEYKESLKEVEHQDWEIKRLRRKISTQLSFVEEDHSPGKIGLKIFLDAAKANITKVDGADFVNKGVLASQRKKSNKAQLLAQELSVDLEKVQTVIPEVERQISLIKGELPQLVFSSYKSDNPLCPVCEVPIDRALAEGCNLSHKLQNSSDIKARWEARDSELRDETGRLKVLKEDLKVITSKLTNARKDADEQSRGLTLMESEEREQRESWYKARRMLDDVNRLDELYAAKETTSSASVKQASAIEKKRQAAGRYRDEQANIITRLSSLFDSIIREFIGVDAKGRVAIDGTGLKLSVEMGGERSTAAIDSLKVIAFDLAIMCMSMEGRTHLPALLIHDSPREADLGLSVYHSLFDFMEKLEKTSSKPLFQYIVTTTTRPPDHLLVKPWLIETICGAPAEARLLRKNL